MSILTSIFGSRGGDGGTEQEMWDAARRSLATRSSGSTELEPYVAQQLEGVRAELAAMYHGDSALVGARRGLNQAVLDLRLVREEAETVDNDTAFAVHRAAAAQQQPDTPDTAHALAEGARARKRREVAQAAVRATEHNAERINAEFQTLVGEMTDRVLVRARASITPLHHYLAIANALRVDAGLEPLEPLPADLPERLVKEATARISPNSQEHTR